MAKYKGVSYLELLLVISIITMILGASIPFASSYINNNNLATMTSTVTNSIREAQFNSISRKNGEEWGICNTGDQIRVYSGSCASPNSSFNYSIQPNVTITGLSDVTFSENRGEPSNSMNIEIKAGSKTNTITINYAGGINY